MSIMTEEELRRLLDSEDCYLIMRNRVGGKSNSVDLVAQRKGSPTREQVYLTTRRLLPIMTEEEIRKKLGVAS